VEIHDQLAEDEAARIRHVLTQRGKDAENWQRQSKDWEAQCETMRGEIAELSRLLTIARDTLRRWETAAMRANREYGELEEAARTVVECAARDDNNVTPDTAAALRALERCVSSTQPAQSGETQLC